MNAFLRYSDFHNNFRQYSLKPIINNSNTNKNNVSLLIHKLLWTLIYIYNILVKDGTTLSVMYFGGRYTIFGKSEAISQSGHFSRDLCPPESWLRKHFLYHGLGSLKAFFLHAIMYKVAAPPPTHLFTCCPVCLSQRTSLI